jgi:Arc/MetJ family transcription regulator
MGRTPARARLWSALVLQRAIGTRLRCRFAREAKVMLMMYTDDVHHQLSVEGAVALTQIDIDEDALIEAMRLSGAKTKKDTVNLALREFAARHRRVAALEHYATLAAGWDFEGWEQRRAAEKDPAA